MTQLSYVDKPPIVRLNFVYVEQSLKCPLNSPSTLTRAQKLHFELSIVDADVFKCVDYLIFSMALRRTGKLC